MRKSSLTHRKHKFRSAFKAFAGIQNNSMSVFRHIDSVGKALCFHAYRPIAAIYAALLAGFILKAVCSIYQYAGRIGTAVQNKAALFAFKTHMFAHALSVHQEKMIDTAAGADFAEVLFLKYITQNPAGTQVIGRPLNRNYPARTDRLNIALGFISLIIINILGSFIGISIGINWLNALVVGIFGVPGAALLLILQWLLLI